MKSRLQRIEILNFKAFKKFNLELEGRHLLVYGPNGSGKSSFYWALYTFLQSAHKSLPSIAKYFDPANPQNLLNIHEDAIAKPGEIALTFRDTTHKRDTTYRISQVVHETHQEPIILKGNLASDFITYRFFFGFSHFRNSETFNIWPLFEQEILPFCVSTGGQVPMDSWLRISNKNPNPLGHTGLAGSKAYKSFKQHTNTFAKMLPGIIKSISDEAQKFYDEHFSQDDPAKVILKLGITTPPSFTGTNQINSRFTIPIVEFGIKVDGTTINRPQVFLNEAKLTQFALSIRFAASLVNSHDSDLKLLVLDDLLVSLDMSNRMKVVEILLSSTFDNYQKIILTHDLGFYREFRRRVGSGHEKWCFQKLDGTPATTITCKSEKTEIQKAEDYLHGYNLDEAALCLRRATEETAERFLNRDGTVDPTKKFVGLRGNLQNARNRILMSTPE